MTDKKKGETLEEFLISMTAQIQSQQDSVMSYSTTLVDLTQELEMLMKDLIDHAITSRKDLKIALDEITLHDKLGSIPEDDGDSLIEKAWIAKGQVDGYLYAVTHLRDLCKTVLGRKDETRH